MKTAHKLLLLAYLAAGGLLGGAYALAEATGWEPAVTRSSITPTVRAPPGSGSSGFWHSGSHGGK